MVASPARICRSINCAGRSDGSTLSYKKGVSFLAIWLKQHCLEEGALGEMVKIIFPLWLKLSRSEPYVYWGDVPRTWRPNRSGEAWEQYYKRMRVRSEDQGKRVVSALLTHKRCEMHYKHLDIKSNATGLFTVQSRTVLSLSSCFLTYNWTSQKKINLYGCESDRVL